MRTLVLTLSAAFIAMQTSAQTIATFEDLTLPGTDTAYVNYSMPGMDVGFHDGLAQFPCMYDTVYGGLWESGFAYSNKKDSVDGGYMHPYSAKAVTGYDSSAEYTVANVTMGSVMVYLTGAAKNKPVKGFYVTNSTYVYNAIRDGYFTAKKFGGPSGNDTDWFKLTVYGYTGGAKHDSVNFYLADYRFSNNALDYIVKDWRWVNLLPLGNVDSLEFTLSSSDTGMYGMNTPAYFCMDNFTTGDGLSVNNIPGNSIAKVYPIPAKDNLFIELTDRSINEAVIYDLSGKLAGEYHITAAVQSINIATLLPGMYILQLKGGQQNASIRFVKQ